MRRFLTDNATALTVVFGMLIVLALLTHVIVWAGPEVPQDW